MKPSDTALQDKKTRSCRICSVSMVADEEPPKSWKRMLTRITGSVNEGLLRHIG